MYGSDVAQPLVDRATETALGKHHVELVTLVVVIQGDTTVHQIPCRPSARYSVLAELGINPNQPLRSPRHAYAWVDDKGALRVGGTSEKGKARLRALYSALAMANEDIVLI